MIHDAAIPHDHPRSLTGRLRASDDGAIVVFGIFFAVLVLGMLYYFVGIAATIYYRERLQDAADASAFASAIVHARGMNTIALINMVMAAVLSVLVTLRLIEALIIIAQAILYALSWLGGATAAVASALEVVRQTVTEIAEEVEPIVQNVLKVLNVAGDVVKVVTPLGSNAGVMTSVRDNYSTEVAFAFAMPTRFTLPVEDDKYDYLCGKAGIMAGKLALLPLSPILPGFVESGVASALESLASAGSSWFCGDGEAPSATVQPEAPQIPRTEDQAKCMGRDKQGEDSVESCRRAEQFDAYSSPGKFGQCRVGERVCIEMDDTDGQLLEFSSDSWCGSEGRGRTLTAEDCAQVPTPDGRLVADEKTPYGARLRMAREQCVPDGKKNNYRWEERELLVEWQRDDQGRWQEVGEPVEVRSEVVEAHPERRTHPCQVEGNEARRILGDDPGYWPLSQPWNAGPITEPVCIADEPKPSEPQVRRVQRRRREVLQIISCSEPKPPAFKQQVNAVNVSADRMRDVGIGSGTPGENVGEDWKDIKLEQGDPGFGGAGALGGGEGASTMGGEQSGAGAGQSGEQGQQGGGEDDSMNPFRFEKGHKLGFSDMQIRSFVIGRALDADELNGKGEAPEEGATAHTHAKRVVEMTKWRATGDELTGLADASEVWGRFAVAQAEYYFDVSATKDDFADWSGEDGERDYLWYMGWTARMRRFRLSWKVDGKSADGDSEESGGGGGGGGGDKMSSPANMALIDMFGGDSSQQMGLTELQESGPSVLCAGEGEADCESLSSQLLSFDSLFLH